MTIRAAILSTGDELTTGRIADTNASWIADKLFELGIDVVAIVAVGDYADRLAWAWRKAPWRWLRNMLKCAKPSASRSISTRRSN